MKTKLLNLTLLSLVFGSISTAQALVNPSDPLLVSIPRFASGYEINASLIWQQPTSSSNVYSILTSPLPFFTPNWLINPANPQYHFGFEVGASFTFGNTGNDVQINWTELKTRDSTSVNINPAVAANQFVGPFYQIGPESGGVGVPAPAPIVSAAAQNHYTYDLVNWDAGQYIKIGHRLQTRLFGGVNFLRIKQNLQTTFFAPTDVNFSFTSTNTSEFTGFGPRFGISASYDLCYGFGIVGQVAGTASVGRIRASDNFRATSTNLITIAVPPIFLNQQGITTHHETRVVPGGDAKLGVNYAFEFVNSSWLTAELGYKVAAYQSAIRTVYPTSLVADPFSPLQDGTIFVNTMGESQSDFGVNGPYFNLSYNF